MTILNSFKHNKKAICRHLHQFSDKFSSMINLRIKLLEELGDDLSESIKFDVGYYESRARCLLVTSDNLKLMYESYKTKEEIHLWCDANDDSSNDKTKKRKRESDEGSVDSIYQDLKQKHGDKYSIPQLRLWARMLHCSTHDSYDKPH